MTFSTLPEQPFAAVAIVTRQTPPAVFACLVSHYRETERRRRGASGTPVACTDVHRPCVPGMTRRTSPARVLVTGHRFARQACSAPKRGNYLELVECFCPAATALRTPVARSDVHGPRTPTMAVPTLPVELLLVVGIVRREAASTTSPRSRAQHFDGQTRRSGHGVSLSCRHHARVIHTSERT